MTPVRRLTALLFLGLGLAGPLAAARAAPAPAVSAADPRQVLAFARGYGRASLDADREGDPHIRGHIGAQDYQIFFYGCRRNLDCAEIQLVAVWPDKRPSLARVNRWNYEKRMARAYLSPDGGLTLDVDVAMDGGIPRAALGAAFDGFRSALEQLNAWPDAGPDDDEPTPPAGERDDPEAAKPNEVI